MSQQEQRAYRRLSLKLTAYCQELHKGGHGREEHTFTTDISAGGVGLVLNKRIDTQQLVLLKLGLPAGYKRYQKTSSESPQETSNAEATFLSRVVWSQTLSENEYRYGLVFLDITLDSRYYFEKFLQEYELEWQYCPLCNDSSLPLI